MHATLFRHVDRHRANFLSFPKLAQLIMCELLHLVCTSASQQTQHVNQTDDDLRGMLVITSEFFHILSDFKNLQEEETSVMTRYGVETAVMLMHKETWPQIAEYRLWTPIVCCFYAGKPAMLKAFLLLFQFLWVAIEGAPFCRNNAGGLPQSQSAFHKRFQVKLYIDWRHLHPSASSSGVPL